MFLVFIMKAMSCFTNVLRNNYNKDKSDDITIAKVSRKLSKFGNCMKTIFWVSTPMVTTRLVYCFYIKISIILCDSAQCFMCVLFHILLHQYSTDHHILLP